MRTHLDRDLAGPVCVKRVEPLPQHALLLGRELEPPLLGVLAEPCVLLLPSHIVLEQALLCELCVRIHTQIALCAPPRVLLVWRLALFERIRVMSTTRTELMMQRCCRIGAHRRLVALLLVGNRVPRVLDIERRAQLTVAVRSIHSSSDESATSTTKSHQRETYGDTMRPIDHQTRAQCSHFIRYVPISAIPSNLYTFIRNYTSYAYN